MDLPIELKIELENYLTGINIEKLSKVSKELTKKYTEISGNGANLIGSIDEAHVYSICRMPATYSAVTSSILSAMNIDKIEIDSLLDVGAGTGAGAWAIYNLLHPTSITCVEREIKMSDIGKQLMVNGPSAIRNCVWKQKNILDIDEKADMVLASYVLSEMSEGQRTFMVDLLWKSASKYLVIVDTGTPKVFNIMKKIRLQLLGINAYQVAPCPHSEKCEMPDNDWCHFVCRLQRSKLHKAIKEGDCPYEDEKFTYLVFSKKEIDVKSSRVIRRPVKESGKIYLKVCTANGIRNITVSKKDKELFKKARKLECGDILD